jgi:ABC-type glycerol-3-phosphate transport system substrate-binding protein
MRRTPLVAMLTLLAILAATLAFAGCGGKSSSGPAKSTTTSTGTQKQPSHPPAY